MAICQDIDTVVKATLIDNPLLHDSSNHVFNCQSISSAKDPLPNESLQKLLRLLWRTLIGQVHIKAGLYFLNALTSATVLLATYSPSGMLGLAIRRHPVFRPYS
ncbi:hypothetical protein K2173_001773 [Erythroxylum novogranatense]|uniref:Uncharacterized protein n=1 Tax=Erythroxylum novogranatense TaxID=1862640 RepID=A0AAV8SIQ7_9ROSI|nr:hypothetical protein K2173_001773 [Erythroxylum novogranatense]